MPYTPVADNAAAPLDTEYASSMGAEFRTLKTKLNLFFLSSDIVAAQNAIYSTKGLALVNGGPGGTDVLFGLSASSTRTAGNGSTFGGYFSAVQGNNTAADVGKTCQGIYVEAFTGSIASQVNTFCGASVNVIQRDPEGQDFVQGICVRFANRISALESGSVVGGLGSDKYNVNSTAFSIQSQRRSTATEKCGWSSGIKFEEYSLDADDTIPIPQAIDFRGISVKDCAANPVIFHLAEDTLNLVAPATNGGAVNMPTKVAGWIPVMVDGTVTMAIPLHTIV